MSQFAVGSSRYGNVRFDEQRSELVKTKEMTTVPEILEPQLGFELAYAALSLPFEIGRGCLGRACL